MTVKTRFRGGLLHRILRVRLMARRTSDTCTCMVVVFGDIMRINRQAVLVRQSRTRGRFRHYLVFGMAFDARFLGNFRIFQHWSLLLVAHRHAIMRFAKTLLVDMARKAIVLEVGVHRRGACLVIEGFDRLDMTCSTIAISRPGESHLLLRRRAVLRALLRNARSAGTDCRHNENRHDSSKRDSPFFLVRFHGLPFFVRQPRTATRRRRRRGRNPAADKKEGGRMPAA